MSLPSNRRVEMVSVILGFDSCAFCFLPFGFSGFLLFHEDGSSLLREYKSEAGAAQSLSMKSK